VGLLWKITCSNFFYIFEGQALACLSLLAGLTFAGLHCMLWDRALASSPEISPSPMDLLAGDFKSGMMVFPCILV
jgi:hypothetical protein